jgi:hypothetical protein
MAIDGEEEKYPDHSAAEQKQQQERASSRPEGDGSDVVRPDDDYEVSLLAYHRWLVRAAFCMAACCFVSCSA